MAFARFLLTIACVALAIAERMLQNDPRGTTLDACRWIARLPLPCPSWAAAAPIPDYAPWALYAVAGFGLLALLRRQFSGVTQEAPRAALAGFIQRARDLHEKCLKHGDRERLAEIVAWKREATRFLRRLGRPYVQAFDDPRVPLFPSQYDTPATLELRRRIQRLSEIAQRLGS